MKPFLCVYDYQTGGVWAVISADSKEQIENKYPVLIVKEERPHWMTDETYSRLQRFGIDGEPPRWLKTALSEN